MITVERISRPPTLVLVVRGELDGDSEQMSQLGTIPAPVQINTEGISRMNSQGLRQWISYFQKISKSEVIYVSCSPAFTNHLGLILSYCPGSRVESVVGPYYCDACGTRTEKLIQTPSGQPVDSQLADQPCSKCGGKAKFDEVPEEYFSFLGTQAPGGATNV